MKLLKIAIVFCLGFGVNFAFAQDEETTTTTTESPEGTTTTRTTEYDRDSGPGVAGFFVEPGIRYDKISGDIDLPAPFGNAGVDADGVGVNARVGFHLFDVMFLAMEGSYSQLHIDEDATSYSAYGSSTSYGPTLGFQTPWAGVRIWGTYLVNGEFDPSSNNGVDLKFKDLDGYKVGVGFRIAKVGASVEYQDATYNTIEVQDAGPLSGNTNLEMKHTGWLASVSFPISL